MPRGTQGHCQESSHFRLRGCHSLCLAFPDPSTSNWIGNSLDPQQRTPTSLTTPILQRLPPITQHGFGLLPFRSPLLRKCSLFLGVLRCFSSPRAPRLAYRFNQRYLGIAQVGSPIRVSPAHRLMTAPRSLSQPSTPFIGSWRQGIHRMPLVA